EDHAKPTKHDALDEGPDRAYEPVPRTAPVGRRRFHLDLPGRVAARGPGRMPAPLPGAALPPAPLPPPGRLVLTGAGEGRGRGGDRGFACGPAGRFGLRSCRAANPDDATFPRVPVHEPPRPESVRAVYRRFSDREGLRRPCPDGA